MRRQRVHRWGVGLVATLALTGTGLLYANATLLGAALIPLTYVLYGEFSQLPDDVSLRVTRTIDPETPMPGEPVEVTLTVEHAGDGVLPDLRLIDGVPPELVVSEGSPRLSVPLSPGESKTISYTVVAKRGVYRFDAPVVRLRSLAGVDRLTREIDIEDDGDRRLTCVNTLENIPEQETATPHAGQQPTDSGGTGLEFHATRKYEHGDPVNRIDWHHVAKTGEFITVQYRETKASKTVVVVDARPVCRVTPQVGYPTGAELAAYAGERLHAALAAAGIATSVAAVGLDEAPLDDDRLAGLLGPDGITWADAGGNNHQAHVETVFQLVQQAAQQDASRIDLSPPDTDSTVPSGQGHSAGGSTPRQTQDARSRQPRPSQERQRRAGVPDAGQQSTERQQHARTDGGGSVERLLARLPPDADIVLCTPVLDNWPVRLVQTLASQGYSQLVVSPDVVTGESPGQRLAATNRRLRLQTIERAGADTVSWNVTQPVEYALRRSLPHTQQ